MPRSILLLFAHPAFQRSKVNRHLVRAVEDLDGVTFQDLYEAYPDLMIDIAKEQALLAEHDVIIFQHPLYWYSTPALLKEWQDVVLTHGWAYGTGGDALQGKLALQVITTGGGAEHYRPDGMNRFTIREFLAPMEQTCGLCGMSYLPPFVVHGTHRLVSEEDMRSYCEDYRRVVEALRDEQMDLTRTKGMETLQDSVADLIISS